MSQPIGQPISQPTGQPVEQALAQPLRQPLGQIGKYQIVRRLGGGGMAEVFAARLLGVEGFARPVAIKRVLPGYSQDRSFASMFIREAQLSARFNHPNVVSVVDFDRDPEHGLFLAMELVEGRDLNDLMHTGLLPIPVVIHLVAEILRGLGYAHDLPPDDSGVRGVIHRDVSPHNVLLSWEGAVKVSDFGIAKARGAATSASASLMIKGKPAYMSPEQANGAKLDGRSDLFAVGVMLWEMLVGRTLFAGGTMHEMFSALFFSPIPSPHDERPEVLEDLAAVTLRLLARPREKRYATAEEAVAALMACAQASRNGRAELIDLLVARFPEQAPARPSRQHAIALGTPTPVLAETLLAPPQTTPTAETLLAATAPVAAVALRGEGGEAAPRATRRPRLLAAFVGVGLLAAAFTLGAVRLLSRSDEPAPAAPAGAAAPGVASATPPITAPVAAPSPATMAPALPATSLEEQKATPSLQKTIPAKPRAPGDASSVRRTSVPLAKKPSHSLSGPLASEKKRTGASAEIPLQEAPNLLKGE